MTRGPFIPAIDLNDEAGEDCVIIRPDPRTAPTAKLPVPDFAAMDREQRLRRDAQDLARRLRAAGGNHDAATVETLLRHIKPIGTL